MGYAIYKPVKDKQPIGIFEIISKIFLFCGCMYICFIVGQSKSETKFVYIDTCDYYSKTELNFKNIEYWLDYFNVQHPEIVTAQIQIETGNLTSRNCIENNNLFGMGFPLSRNTTATYKDGRYAGYPNYIESIRCYAMWQQYCYNGTEDYYGFLKRVGYAEDTTYIYKLKSIVNAK